MPEFKAKAYLKTDCPYSFKYLLFMSEAGLLDQIELIRCNPNEPQFAQAKDLLQAATGAKATFPTVEIERGVYKSDSEELIRHYAAVHGVAQDKLPALRFYREGIFPQLLELHPG